MLVELDLLFFSRFGRGGLEFCFRMYIFCVVFFFWDFCWNFKGIGRIIFNIVLYSIMFLLVRGFSDN